jgi:hypothetical protein
MLDFKPGDTPEKPGKKMFFPGFSGDVFRACYPVLSDSRRWFFMCVTGFFPVLVSVV